MVMHNCKGESAHKYLPTPIVAQCGTTRLGIIAFGTTDPAVTDVAQCLAGGGIFISYLRLRALPLTEPVQIFLEAHSRIYVVELNIGRQLFQWLQMTYPPLGSRLVSLPHNNGLPPTSGWIAEKIIALEEDNNAFHEEDTNE